MRVLLAVVLFSGCNAEPPVAVPGDPHEGDPPGDPTSGDLDLGDPGPYTGPTHPEGGRIVWASNRNGTHDVYSMKADGTEVQQLTFTGGRGPIWSPDGQWIAYQNAPTWTVRLMRPDGSDDKLACEDVSPRDGPIYFWMHDGSGLVCPTTDSVVPTMADLEFHLVDPETGASEYLFRQYDFTHLVDKRFDPGSITRDGRYLLGWAHNVYTGGLTGDNGTFDAFHATVILDIEEKSKIYMLGSGCLSATSPVDDTVFNVARDTPTVPDIFRMQMADLETRASYRMELGFEDSDWGHEYMPSISNDGEWVVYAASVSCHPWYSCDYEIFIHRLGAGTEQRERLTFHSGNDNFPSLFVEP